MRIARLLVGTIALASTTLVVENARAEDLSACGDFFFDPVGEVSCTVEVEGGCEAQCTPVSFAVECAAELRRGGEEVAFHLGALGVAQLRDPAMLDQCQHRQQHDQHGNENRESRGAHEPHAASLTRRKLRICEATLNIFNVGLTL